MGDGQFRALARVRDDVVIRVVVYYALLVGVVALLWRYAPFGNAWAGSDGSGDGGMGKHAAARAAFAQAAANPGVETSLAMSAGLAMCTAALLALPVAWVYTLTRHKKGYRQSIVQTLVLLPVVVAGVVVLVKNSLALAFSLAGIVAAVRFRNTLEDTKDAVYLFLVTAVGIAAGVQLSVATVLSVVFNLVVFALWYTDFGRSGAPLEGVRAERIRERALAQVSRTGTFVARLDEELLKSLSSDQLEALGDRAWRRRKRNEPDLADEGAPHFTHLLRIRTHDPAAARESIEPVLRECLTRWRYGGVVHEADGTHTVEYGAELAAGVSSPALIELIRARGAEQVIDAVLR
ncbi:MAG: hypothetical protein NVS1B4_12800 [Gemmatimonadaceae bacterium]